MSIVIDGRTISEVYAGSEKIREIYHGADLVWSSTPDQLDFEWEKARTEPYRILFMGSSSVAGFGVAPSEEWTHQVVAHIVSGTLNAPAVAPTKVTSGSPASPTAPGFHFINAGVGGTNSQTYWGDGRKAVVASYRPRLIVHMVGSNDWSTGVSPATYRANIERCLTEATTRAPGCQHLLVHAFPRVSLTSPTHEWADYADQLARIAASRDDTQVCDTVKIMGDRWTGEDMLLDDNVHANWFGNTICARAVAEHLGLDANDGTKIVRYRAANASGTNNLPVNRGWIADPDSAIPVRLDSPTNDNLPFLRNNGDNVKGPLTTVDFYNGAKKMQAEFGGAIAAPLTVIIAALSWNVGSFGTNQKPLFSRISSADDGYMWGWHLSNEQRAGAAMNTASSDGTPLTNDEMNSPSVVAFTFHPNGWTTIRVNSTVGTDLQPRSISAQNGPWMKSLKLMTNTGETSWGEANIYEISIYKGADDELVSNLIRHTGALRNIPITTRVSDWTNSNDHPASPVMPDWADTVQLVAVGGGGGGAGGGIVSTGDGGRAGTWAHTAIDVTAGTTISWSAGSGGQPGSVNASNGTAGEATTFTINGQEVLRAAGGDRGTSTNGNNPGRAAGAYTAFGNTFTGGGAASNGQSGNPPGGGGGPGAPLAGGRGGAAGQVWWRFVAH